MQATVGFAATLKLSGLQEHGTSRRGQHFPLECVSTVYYFCKQHFNQMKKRDKILQAVRQQLRNEFGEKIKDIVLFGSQVWGKPTRTSDWDFVVVVRGSYDWRTVQSIRYAMADIDMEHDIFTQTLVVSDAELTHSIERYEPVFAKALSQGIYA